MTGPAVFAQSVWTVREGEETAFVERWRAMVDHTLASRAATRFLLLRDRASPRRFVTLGAWVDLPTMTAHRARAEFRSLFQACRALCESFDGADFALVATEGSGGTPLH